MRRSDRYLVGVAVFDGFLVIVGSILFLVVLQNSPAMALDVGGAVLLIFGVALFLSFLICAFTLDMEQ
jgi:hypothetical protein